MKKESNIYSHRYIARVVLEAETPLFVGSGDSSLLKDALVQKDIHGLPMIQGTSLAGILRHAIEDRLADEDKEYWNDFFGYQLLNSKESRGSRVKISSAYLVIENNRVAEGLTPGIDINNYRAWFEDLPVRQHVKITHKGTAKEHGLFDNEVVYKGCRFLFEVELKGTEEDEEKWDEFLSTLNNPMFRIGQGTRNGYGKLRVVQCRSKMFDLRKEEDFQAYMDFDPSLNIDNKLTDTEIQPKNKNVIVHYQLMLKPESFFTFSAGYGDEEVDSVPVQEEVITYDANGTMQSPRQFTLIPASSIKGAISHRVAYHYNKRKNIYADEINDDKFFEFVEEYNKAVYELFGGAEGSEAQDEGIRGKVIFDDILDNEIKNDKIFNHVAIDRFTGGAMDGALFSEKVSYFDSDEKVLELNIYVEKEPLQDEVIKGALEDALTDICRGLLPLGGMTTKGNGIFTGNLFRDDEEIFNYENQ